MHWYRAGQYTRFCVVGLGSRTRIKCTMGFREQRVAKKLPCRV